MFRTTIERADCGCKKERSAGLSDEADWGRERKVVEEQSCVGDPRGSLEREQR